MLKNPVLVPFGGLSISIARAQCCINLYQYTASVLHLLFWIPRIDLNPNSRFLCTNLRIEKYSCVHFKFERSESKRYVFHFNLQTIHTSENSMPKNSQDSQLINYYWSNLMQLLQSATENVALQQLRSKRFRKIVVEKI